MNGWPALSYPAAGLECSAVGSANRHAALIVESEIQALALSLHG